MHVSGGSGNTAVNWHVCVTLRESWNHVSHCRKFDKLVDISPVFPATENLECHSLVSSSSVNDELGNYHLIEVFSISVNIKTHPKHGNRAGNKLATVVFSAQENQVEDLIFNFSIYRKLCRGLVWIWDQWKSHWDLSESWSGWVSAISQQIQMSRCVFSTARSVW